MAKILWKNDNVSVVRWNTLTIYTFEAMSIKKSTSSTTICKQNRTYRIFRAINVIESFGCLPRSLDANYFLNSKNILFTILVQVFSPLAFVRYKNGNRLSNRIHAYGLCSMGSWFGIVSIRTFSLQCTFR